jgi:hypothetical protein
VTEPLALTYFLYVILWAIIGGIYAQQLYMKVDAENRLLLQKWVMIIPFVKCLELGLNGGWFNMCPWNQLDHSGI